MKYFRVVRGFGVSLLVLSLILVPVAPAFAQLGGTVPPTVTPPATPPAPVAPPAPDLCPNIAGTQTSIPTGMVLDGSGNCVNADTTPPVISGVATATLLPTAATLVWTTDELSVSTFEYGASQGYGLAAALAASAAIGGTATLVGLAPSTLYYYCIHATDLSNNTSNSCSSFTTAALPDVIAPILSVVVAVTATTSATITWTTNENADGQVRYGATASYGSTSNLDSTLGLAHSATLSNLSPNTSYHYSVLSRDTAGNLATGGDETFTTGTLPISTVVSAPVTVTVIDTVPPAITDISSVSLEPHVATIIWTTDELATSTLEYGTTMNYGSSATLPAGTLLSHSATLLGLQTSTTYYFCIRATDLAGNTSSCGSDNTFTTAAAQVTLDTTPPTVSLVTIAPITTSSASITWATTEVANGYIQYGTTDAYGSQTPLDTALSLTHSAPISELAPNTVYHYRVVSSDEAGNTTMTPDNTFTTNALPVPAQVSVPSAPADINPPSITDITNASVGPTDVSVAWTTSELAVSTFEYGPTQSYGSSATLPLSAGFLHSATLAGLSPGTMYYYCIHATDLAGNTADSCGHSVTTGAAPLVRDTTPPALWVIAVASLATSSATITWASDKVADFYAEYGTTTNYGSQTSVTTNPNLSGSVTLSNLSPNMVYHFRVHSSDSSGNTAVSSDETFTTGALPNVVVRTPADTTPPLISGIAESTLLATSTTIAWITDELATSTLEYGTTMNYGAQATIATTALLAHTATILNLSPSTTYYYCIHATDLAGNTANSCNHSFTTDAAPIVAPVVVAPPQVSSSSGSVSVTAPTVVISRVAADSIGETRATITWTTDVPADSRVQHGDDMEFDESSSNAALTTSHSVTLTGLNPNTSYDFRVVSKPAGASAVETTSNIYDFNTLAAPAVLDPAANILSVSASSIQATSASVSWTTDEGTSGSVEYGLTTAYGQTALASTSLQTSGTVALSPLLPNTTYHFRVKVIDAADNITYSDDHVFTISASVSVQSSSGAGGIASTTTITATSTASSSTSIENTPALVSQTSPSTAVASGGGGGGGGGGFFVSAPTPALITAAPTDSQVMFMWNNPRTANFAGTIVVRKQGSYPTSPSDGQTIYQGASSTFTDTNLKNATTYYYALYSYTTGGEYSNPLQVSLAPSAGVSQVQLNSNPILQPAISMDHFATDLKVGDKNLEVEHLQQILNTVNAHPSGLTTGYFGPLTQAALKIFQAKYNLPQTGVADAPTRAILSSISQGWMISSAPNGLANLQTDLKRGDSGQDVANLQKFLVYEGSYQEGIISGTFGPLTQKSVANFQTKYGVTPVSGYVGYKTRHTIQTVLGL